MAQIVRDYFVDSVSGTAVQLRRVPGLTYSPSSSPAMVPHQINIVTGGDSAANADTDFYRTSCIRYRVSIERIS